MPEGHTVHRIARDHQRDFLGQALAVSSPQGRFLDGAKALNGQMLVAVEAHGKHLCYHWNHGELLHVHLGLYGKFRRHRLPVPDPRGQVRLRVVGARLAFDLNGPNACQLVSQQSWSAIRQRLGADPLRADSDPEQAWSRIRRSRSPLGALLLNQSVIAGVGNVYRSEVLHLLRIHPARMANSLTRLEFDLLWDQLVSLLRIGVRYNRIIVANPDDLGKPRSRMNRQERLLIYKRQHCSSCERPVDVWLLGGRKVYACPRCQQQ